MAARKNINQNRLKKNIDHFRKASYFFAEYFGLVQWELHVFERETTSRGEAEWDSIGRIARVYYGNEWIRKYETSLEEIAKTAFHELAELLQHETYDNLGRYRGWEFAQQQTHVVIRMLENRLFSSAYKEFLAKN